MPIENKHQIKDIESAIKKMNHVQFLLSMEVTKYNRDSIHNQFYILYLINDLKNLYRWAHSYVNTREEFDNNKELMNYSQLIFDLEEILKQEDFNKKFFGNDHVNDMHVMSKRLRQFGERSLEIKRIEKGESTD
ncbi:hypothetical protein [Staphylococcus equorum]|uniref:hypothetical protein n=1 Tax=Staphylococcus equorum TaxID=246432 RepID=UPI0018674007|nr:hypothetical protein [Staphylococcus equorum]